MKIYFAILIFNHNTRFISAPLSSFEIHFHDDKRNFAFAHTVHVVGRIAFIYSKTQFVIFLFIGRIATSPYLYALRWHSTYYTLYPPVHTIRMQCIGNSDEQTKRGRDEKASDCRPFFYAFSISLCYFPIFRVLNTYTQHIQTINTRHIDIANYYPILMAHAAQYVGLHNVYSGRYAFT